MREENVALIVVTHTDELAKKMSATARLIDGKLSGA
jgi:ABC-type lipoprotein export system ATPase subunit